MMIMIGIDGILTSKEGLELMNRTRVDDEFHILWELVDGGGILGIDVG
jgi:hypothetical protein